MFRHCFGCRRAEDVLGAGDCCIWYSMDYRMVGMRAGDELMWVYTKYSNTDKQTRKKTQKQQRKSAKQPTDMQQILTTEKKTTRSSSSAFIW